MHRPAMLPDARDRGRNLRHCVVIREGRPVSGPALRDQAHPGDALLGGLDEIEPTVIGQGERKAADLAHALADTVKQVGPVIDDPVRSVLAACLLVRDKEEDQVPLRAHAGPAPRARERDEHGIHVLHVHGSASPDHPVVHFGGEGGHRPIRRARGHDIEVTVQEQPRLRGIRSR